MCQKKKTVHEKVRMTTNNVKYVKKAKRLSIIGRRGVSRHVIFFTIAGAYNKNCYIVSKGQRLRPCAGVPSAGDSSLSVALSSFCRSSIDLLCLVGSRRSTPIIRSISV
jgi:hypothetical protein